ncbi:MAG: glycosyltransferase [Christensenellales bacterium]
MSNIKIAVVVYNKCITECQTINALKNMTGIEVFLADNSTKDYGNRGLAEKAGYHYVDMGGNKGLSKAYNAVINKLVKNDDILCLFDDDTTVDMVYFEKLKAAEERYPHIDIFAPIVRDKIGLLSPCIIHGVNVKRAASLQQIPQDAISAINSGLAIRLKIFENYRYDEGLFLDYVDHAFLKDTISHDKSRIHMIDTVIEQHFSGSERMRREAKKIRYKIFKKDITYFCKKYAVPFLYKEKLLLKRKMHLMLSSLFN